jgi:GDP-4-dehydro-6-deoxy-D-mannose reductase
MSGRALVTGANGFLGRHVVAELARRGWAVTGLRFRFDKEGAAPQLVLGGTDFSGELDDCVREVSPDLIMHVAGTSRPPLMTDVNVGLAVRLLGAVRRIAPRARLLMIGSAAEYGEVPDDALPVREDHPCRPLSPYGITKYAQTLAGLAAIADGLDMRIARCFNLVGAGMPPHAPLMEIAARLSAPEFDGTVAVGNLDMERDLVDVADAARAIVGLAEHPSAAGQIVNICSGRGRLLRDVVEHLVADISPRPRLLADGALAARPAVPRMVGHPGRLDALGLSVPPADPGAVARAITTSGNRVAAGRRQADAPKG